MEKIYVWVTIKDMPMAGWIFWGILLLSVLCFHCRQYMSFKKQTGQYKVSCYIKENKRNILVSVLVLYIAWVLSVTLIARQPGEIRKYHLIPLWSLPEAVAEIKELYFWGMPRQILYNIIAFLPIGYLLYFIRSITMKKAFLFGFGFSAIIECLQLIFILGDFEWDDMLYNAIGCAIGVWIASKVKQRMLKSILIKNNSIDKTDKKV